MKINTANTILYCTHWKETVSFYRDVLGLAVSFSNEWFVEFEVSGDARLSIANEKRASIQSGNGRGITLSFKVDDVEEAHASLRRLGVEPTSLKKRWGSQVFYIHDPERNRIEFWEQ